MNCGVRNGHMNPSPSMAPSRQMPVTRIPWHINSPPQQDGNQEENRGTWAAATKYNPEAVISDPFYLI